MLFVIVLVQLELIEMNYFDGINECNNTVQLAIE